MVTAFVAIKPFDPSQPDDAPDRLQHIEEIISCYSVAGEPSYLLKVQVPTMAHLEALLARIRADGKVLDPHHHRAVHPVRGPAADLSAGHDLDRAAGDPRPGPRATRPRPTRARHRAGQPRATRSSSSATTTAPAADASGAPRSTSGPAGHARPSSMPTCTRCRPGWSPPAWTCTTRSAVPTCSTGWRRTQLAGRRA